MGRAGIDLFIEDGAYTTLSSAVVILVVLALLFSSTAAIWSMSRAGDTQVAADSGALAGANVVSSYHTAATVVDASILSLGLAGFATIGTGLVAILIPGAELAAGDMLDTGIEIIKMRNKFAKSASKGLQKIETALPYLVATRATQAVSAQDTEGATYTGTALAVPRTSESDFVALEGSEISIDIIKDTSKDLERAADELQKASEETAKAKERAWLADCGGSDPASVGSCSCMWERARSLAKLSDIENPLCLERHMGAASGARSREGLLPLAPCKRGASRLKRRDEGGVGGAQGVLYLCERRGQSRIYNRRRRPGHFLYSVVAAQH